MSYFIEIPNILMMKLKSINIIEFVHKFHNFCGLFLSKRKWSYNENIGSTKIKDIQRYI